MYVWNGIWFKAHCLKHTSIFCLIFVGVFLLIEAAAVPEFSKSVTDSDRNTFQCRFLSSVFQLCFVLLHSLATIVAQTSAIRPPYFIRKTRFLIVTDMLQVKVKMFLVRSFFIELFVQDYSKKHSVNPKIVCKNLIVLIFCRNMPMDSLKRQLGVNLCISDFLQACISETANRRSKWTKSWASRGGIQSIQSTFDC